MTKRTHHPFGDPGFTPPSNPEEERLLMHTTIFDAVQSGCESSEVIDIIDEHTFNYELDSLKETLDGIKRLLDEELKVLAAVRQHFIRDEDGEH